MNARASESVAEVADIDAREIPGRILEADEPVVLKGLVAHWPCVSAAREGDLSVIDYLRRFCRDRDILFFRGHPGSDGRYFYSEDFTGFNFERVTAKLPEVLDRFSASVAAGTTEHFYVGSTAVDTYLPGFRQENSLALDHLSPLVSIWFGNPSRIAAHFDVPQNIACVVAGRRRFTLFPPDQLANLYVGPLDFTPAGQAISLVDFANPDFERYPRFADAMAAARVVDLAPGDALLLPSMWWHHVEGLDPFNALVNYWWNTGQGASGNPLNALIHALMSIRGLPAPQRAAWRGLFDYYVFSDEGSRCDHIPAGRRGVLGEIDDAMLKQLRAMLRNKLGG